MAATEIPIEHDQILKVGATVPKNIVLQSVNVHKVLLSFTKVADVGYECHLHSKEGCLFDENSGERVSIFRKGKLYVMKD